MKHVPQECQRNKLAFKLLVSLNDMHENKNNELVTVLCYSCTSNDTFHSVEFIFGVDKCMSLVVYLVGYEI